MIAPASLKRTFSNAQIIVVLDLDRENGCAYAALAQGTGELAKKSWRYYWRTWKPRKPNDVTVSKVKFISGKWPIDKKIYGKLSQTNIAKKNLPRVLNHIIKKEQSK